MEFRGRCAARDCGGLKFRNQVFGEKGTVMKTRTSLILGLLAVIALAWATPARAGLVGQLGVLDEAWFVANPNNPGTGAAWEVGDTYHLVFVTSTERNAVPSDIGVYNSFVQGRADAAGLGSVTWKAIGCTSTVDAKDNAIVSGPVYRTDGELVASGYDDMWTGGISNPISVTEDGQGSYTGRVFTGSAGGGVTHEFCLGSGDYALRGDAGSSTGDWLVKSGKLQVDDTEPYYGLSAPLSVTPEPATLALLGLGGLGLVLGRKRR